MPPHQGRPPGVVNGRVTRAALCLVCLVGAAARSGAAAPPPTNIAGPAYGTRVTADTQYSDQYAPRNAVDGRLEAGDGCWYSKDQTPLPCALTFELAEPEDIRVVVLYQAAWHGNMYHTKDFALEVSADGKAWHSAAKGQLPDENLARLEVPLEDVRTRWLRIVVLTSYNSFQTCGLTEVELLAAGHVGFGPPAISLNRAAAPPPSLASSGFFLIAGDTGPQLAITKQPPMLYAAVRAGEEVRVAIPLTSVTRPATAGAQVQLLSGEQAEVRILVDGEATHLTLTGGARPIQATAATGADRAVATLVTRGTGGEALVRWSGLRLTVGSRSSALPVAAAPTQPGAGPPPIMPAVRPATECALLEWDWRMQDGVETPRKPSTYAEAIERMTARGDQLIADLTAAGVDLRDERKQWQLLKGERTGDSGSGEEVWRQLHRLKRSIALKNSLAKIGPLLFVKQVPGAFSHQLTQYYGRYARPGGGVFVLDRPGQSMACRQLAAGALPEGSYQHPEVSYDGRRVLFSYCQVDSAPKDTIQGEHGRYYHLYEMAADGAGLRQLTDGAFDDFSPRILPNGQFVFISTRRLGWHRCGYPGCENYTLTLAEADGSKPRTISCHETQEWDPAVLDDGRIIYTRWDYVDRAAVHYEQLWSVLPDGSGLQAVYGNMTLSPVGIWEARAVPGSKRIMATAAAHHAMTAGSIILVDVAAGVDGAPPIIRLTPDAPFPESETTVTPAWHANVAPPYTTPEAERWPGHCYRSPHPLSETYFLAAYSFDSLVGEAQGNPANMFGLYLVDRFGNKELLYRDLNIASLWPTPLRPHPRPPVLCSGAANDERDGLFLLQDIRESTPSLSGEAIKRLRVIQVLPKSTPGIDRPPMGIPSGVAGKQVLGTVPVEADGSAYFRAPAGVPLAFQALDENGLAVQVMRSATYLRPGERASCIGCHEPRTTAPLSRAPLALRHAPSTIDPAPDGSKPLSYPILVQPVLDQYCVSCHGGAQPAGGVSLTGAIKDHYTVSYLALAPRVPYSDNGNGEPLSRPGRFGARGSSVMPLLLAGHHGVKLDREAIERLATWMDANVLFYGTFDPDDQARQQRGERIAGPKLE